MRRDVLHAVSDNACGAVLRRLLISTALCAPLITASAIAAPTERYDVALAIDATTDVDLGVEMPAEDSRPAPDPKPYSAKLRDLTNERSSRTLDARRPEVDLRFDLSANDDIAQISVTLSADPLPGTDDGLPLIVSFNGGETTEIETRGQGFDTTVTLDPRRVRATGNVLTVGYPAPCDSPGGGYRLDLERSSLNLQALPSDGAPQLRDVEHRLSSPLFAPRNISLMASGPDEARLRLLAAQATALRMPFIADYRSGDADADFDILMMTRTELAAHTDNIDILLGTGPAIMLDPEEPNRLILTGETPDELLHAVQAFATASLPDSRLAETTPAQMLTQPPLDTDRNIVDATANLDGLSVKSGTLRDYRFDVSDPAATKGQLVLRLKRDEQTPSGTRLKATLNGTSLGDARVRGRRRTVAYPIPQGVLVGTDNSLTLTTQEVPQTPRCGTSEPFIAIASGSELQLSSDTPSLPGDLSRFTANGTLFAENDGAGTVIILPEDEDDFLSALPVAAQLAEANGRGWIQAEVARGDTDLTDRHVLVIEPADEIGEVYRKAAPRALQASWLGLSQGEDKPENIQKLVSADSDEAIRLAARVLGNEASSHYQGVAGIFPLDDGQLIGVISNAGDASFASALRPLTESKHWNDLSGGVARWNADDVFIAQAALPMTGLSEAVVTDRDDGDTLRARWLAHVAQSRDKLPSIAIKTPDPEPFAKWMEQNRIRLSEGLSEVGVDMTSAQAQGVAIQSKVKTWQDRSAEMNKALWRHLGIPEQRMSSARLGQAQVLPGLTGLILIFLAGLVSTAFTSSGNRRR